VNAVVAVIVLGFFFSGLSDGSVSSYNMLLWLGVLCALALVVGGSLFLRRSGKVKAGLVVNLLLVVPALIFGLFFFVLILANPSWH
jgi:hypothetical protein